MSNSVNMSSTEALLEQGNFNTDDMIGAIAKDLYKTMVARIEFAKPELEFDVVHKLAILNAAEFCKECIESDGHYDNKEKVIMSMVGSRLMEMFEDEYNVKPDTNNA